MANALRRFISNEKEENRRQMSLDKTVSLLGLPSTGGACKIEMVESVTADWGAVRKKLSTKKQGPAKKNKRAKAGDQLRFLLMARCFNKAQRHLCKHL